jgi:DNA-binding transcriptional ArsR family regulator
MRGASKMSMADREAVFAALADEHRRLLLERLRRTNGQTLSNLCEGLKISRQAVTKHLLALEDAGLILTRRKGREKLHYLNPVPINAIAMRWLRQFDAVKLEMLTGPELQAQAKGPG